MTDEAGRAEKGGALEANRAAGKRELRAMFADVNVSLSVELIADRRRAAAEEQHPSRPEGPDRRRST
jgi:hypothetical protein